MLLTVLCILSLLMPVLHKINKAKLLSIIIVIFFFIYALIYFHLFYICHYLNFKLMRHFTLKKDKNIV